jgi:hypothetical protein
MDVEIFFSGFPDARFSRGEKKRRGYWEDADRIWAEAFIFDYTL